MDKERGILRASVPFVGKSLSSPKIGKEYSLPLRLRWNLVGALSLYFGNEGAAVCLDSPSNCGHV